MRVRGILRPTRLLPVVLLLGSCSAPEQVEAPRNENRPKNVDSSQVASSSGKKDAPPPVDETLTLERALQDEESHQGKRVAWHGKLISMDRDADTRRMQMVFLGNEGAPRDTSDMRLFAVDCEHGEVSEDLVLRIATSDDPIWATGTIEGSDDVTITVNDGESVKKTVPLLVAPLFSFSQFGESADSPN